MDKGSSKKVNYTERHRNYCFTSFNCDVFLNGAEKWHLWADNGVDYIIYQEELCPKTKKKHIQGYVEFNDRVSFKRFKKIFGDNTIHIEKRMGSQDEAINYCKKVETRISGPYEFGIRKEQGKRSDLESIAEEIKRGVSLEEIGQKYPGQFIRYYRGIERLYFDSMNANIPNFKKVETTVLWGDAGTGKTKYVYDKFDSNDVFRLRRSNNGTLWFDGYRGQKVLLIDEFYGWITWSDLLAFTDGYKLRLDIKGGHTFKAWDYVYITSNKHPEKWYNDFNCMNKPELRRRIKEIVKFEYEDENMVPSKPLEKTYEVSKANDGKLCYKLKENGQKYDEIENEIVRPKKPFKGKSMNKSGQKNLNEYIKEIEIESDNEI